MRMITFYLGTFCVGKHTSLTIIDVTPQNVCYFLNKENSFEYELQYFSTVIYPLRLFDWI